MTYQNFAQLMSGVESIFVIGAIVVGGFWAYRKFTELLEKDRAQANLDKIRADIQQIDLDRRRKIAELDRFEQIAGAQSV